MPFLDLSDDILHLLWQHIDPFDIVNFALTDRHVHALGYKRLSEHRELVKKYTVVCIDSHGACNHQRGCTFKAKHPIDILVDVAEKPIIASYIRSITLAKGRTSLVTRRLEASAGQKLVEHNVLARLKYEQWEYDGERTGVLRPDRVGFCAALGVLLKHVTGLRHMEFDSANSAFKAMRCKLNHPRSGERIISCFAAKFVEVELSLSQNPPCSEPLGKYIHGSGDSLTVKFQNWWRRPNGSPFDQSIELKGIQAMLQGCVKLRHLRILPGMCKLSDFARILENAPNLESFRYLPGNDTNSLVVIFEYGSRYYSAQHLCNYLNKDKDGQLRKVKMVAELVGDSPQREVRITKRDDIDWGEDENHQEQNPQVEQQNEGHEQVFKLRRSKIKAPAALNTDAAQQAVSSDVTEQQETGNSTQQSTLEKPAEMAPAE